MYFSNNQGDSGSIAKELFSEGFSEIMDKCKVVEMTVEDKDFTREEALKIYGVTKEQYENYLEKKVSKELIYHISFTAESLLHKLLQSQEFNSGDNIEFLIKLSELLSNSKEHGNLKTRHKEHRILFLFTRYISEFFLYNINEKIYGQVLQEFSSRLKSVKELD